MLLLFVLRAMLPAGFMPDLRGLGEGRFQIVICSAGGLKSVSVDDSGRPVDERPSDETGQGAGDCPYGSVVGKVFVAPAIAAAALPPLPEPASVIAGAAASLRPPAQGPPLGSRAPPDHLG